MNTLKKLSLPTLVLAFATGCSTTGPYESTVLTRSPHCCNETPSDFTPSFPLTVVPSENTTEDGRTNVHNSDIREGVPIEERNRLESTHKITPAVLACEKGRFEHHPFVITTQGIFSVTDYTVTERTPGACPEVNPVITYDAN